jgi:hypothetical protein
MATGHLYHTLGVVWCGGMLHLDLLPKAPQTAWNDPIMQPLHVAQHALH